ncbi:hypothetical protein QW131_00720 [Roseibium salinum]|nr:hypothetical protein [Roseibium salinum]
MSVLKQAGKSKTALARLVARGLTSGPVEADCLERLGLDRPKSWKDLLLKYLVTGALAESKDTDAT